MIIEDQEISLSRVFLAVGVIIFISSIIYITIIASKLVALRRTNINREGYAKEKIQMQPVQIVTPIPRR